MAMHWPQSGHHSARTAAAVAADGADDDDVVAAADYDAVEAEAAGDVDDDGVAAQIRHWGVRGFAAALVCVGRMAIGLEGRMSEHVNT